MSPKAPTPTRTRQKSPNVLRSRRNGQWKVSTDHRGGAARRDRWRGGIARRGWPVRFQWPSFPQARCRGTVLCLRYAGQRRRDLRKLPLSMRKASLARLLARRVDGIFLSDFEQGEIGPDLFRHACLMGGWSRSIAIAPIVPAARHTGSR